MYPFFDRYFALVCLLKREEFVIFRIKKYIFLKTHSQLIIKTRMISSTSNHEEFHYLVKGFECAVYLSVFFFYCDN